MRQEINLFIFILVLFGSISSVYGLETVNVKQGEYKKLLFEINNSYTDELRYSIYSVGWYPWIFFSYSQITVPPGESKNISVFLQPSVVIEKGEYYIKLIAKSRKDEIEKHLKIIVSDLKKPEIKEFVCDGKNLGLVVESEENFGLFLDIYKEDQLIKRISENISVGENSFTFPLDSEYGAYVAEASFLKDTTVITRINKSYSIQYLEGSEQKSNVVESRNDWNYYFVSGSRLVFDNKGRTTENKKYSVFVDKFQDSFFIATDYKEKLIEGSSYKYIWEFVLLPNQKYIISYSYNYSLFLILCLAIIFFIVLLSLSLRREVKVKKFLVNRINKLDEGKEVGVCIEVINKTKHELNNVLIEDYIQPIFKLNKEFAGVRPDKIIKIGAKDKLVWKVSRFEPRETRVFSYKITPRVGLIETYSFSLAKVRYKIKELVKLVFSNQITI
ncbi:MAG: hypothetical protein DRP06_04120 [Candidatus Aenigmatarchaeota archaeon]|nr:MAG: hypothetical protein DRP06_04120 [Candidatus Aenigmarchaeota archaeon]